MSLMKRDLELVKRIAVAVEGKRDFMASEIEIPGQEPWVVARHVELMVATGILDGSPGPDAIEGQRIYRVRDLTNFGHDFAGSIQDAAVWTQLADLFPGEKLQQTPLRVVAGTAIRLMEISALQAAGLPVDTH